MNKTKHILLFLIFTMFSLSLFAQDKNKYIVFLKRSPSSIRANSSRKLVIRELKSDFAKSKAKINKYFKKNSPTDDLWSSNAVIFDIDKNDVEKVRKDPNVLEISKANEEFYLEPARIEIPELENQAAQWGVRQIGASKVWKELKIDGSGIVVGCIDSGITPSNPALKNQIIGYKDFTKHGNSRKPVDGLGHGTHVAGIIAGKKSGMGVAPGAKLLVARIFDNNGKTTLETILKAMQWMLEPDKKNPNAAPRVVNSSWNSKNTKSKQFWNILQAWRKAGIIPVFGAGNNGNMGGKVGTPANYPQSLAVGATQKNDKYFVISSQGPAIWDGISYIKPDITAPGRDIVSAGNKGPNVTKSGTSMAAPHVAGVIALILEANPNLSDTEIINIIKQTAVDLGDPGPDNKFGYGRIDAYKAVKKAEENFDFNQATNFLASLVDQEESLSKDENNNSLSSAFAYHLVTLGRTMKDADFKKLYIATKSSGTADAKQLIEEIKKVRKFEKLQK